MNSFALSTSYSLWLVIPCIVIAGAGAWWFYKGQVYKDQLSNLKRNILRGFRFTVLFLLFFLILDFAVKIVTNEKNKPIIVIARDNSESIVANADSMEIRTLYNEKLESISK